MRPLSLAGLALGTLLVVAACTDQPTQVLVPDEAALARGGQTAAPPPVRMLSRNLYLGADIDRVLEDPVGGSALAFAELMHTDYPTRAMALAAEIAQLRPQVIGLQEVAHYDIFTPDGMGGEHSLATIPFLGILQLNLAALGVHYDVAVFASNIEVVLPLPAELFGGLEVYVRYRDADAILVAPGVQVHAAGMKHFDAQVELPGIGPNLRSFQWADVTVERQRFLFVNTHLEIQRWAAFQEAQTAELLAFVDDWGGPVFMVGDFNSAANPSARPESRTATYDMVLAAGFDDLWLRGNGRFTDDGLTCCHASDLSNAEPELDQRIDFVFGRNTPPGRGYAGGVEMAVVGDESDDRIQTPLGYFLWPSDHAGVFAELWMPPGLVARR
jgi:endonuclease/exonuclease/phosphatase family metal-dependent hydrolase